MSQPTPSPEAAYGLLAPGMPEGCRPALREALEAVARSPDNTGMLMILASRLHAEEEPAALHALLRWMVPLVAERPATLLHISMLLGATGMRQEAIACARQAAALAPLDSQGHLHLGALLLAEEAPRAAAHHLAQHTSMAGATTNGWYMLSVALHQAGDIRRAIEAGLRAAERAPDEADIVLSLAGLLGVVGRYGDAMAALERLLAVRLGEARAWRSLAGMREAVGRLGDALEAASQACALAPSDAALTTYRDHLAALLQPFGLPDGAAAWEPRRGPRRAARTAPPLLAGRRVINWLMKVVTLTRWEMQTRFVHSRLGYAWGVVEPLSHVATIGVVFAFSHVGHPPIGDSLFLFYITGICLYMALQRGADEVAQSLAAGRPQLQLPNVKVLDVMFARVALSTATETVSLILLLSGMGLLGHWVWPDDFGICAAALLLCAGMGLGVGMINMVLRQFIRSWEYVWQIGSRFLYFLSGIYYSPVVMPNQIREIIVWNPVLQAIELFRSGFYPNYDPPWLMPDYLFTVVAFLLLLGLALQRVAMRRLLATVAT